ncbi:MAG: GNAT family N-acetyltransferase [Actinomycetota bacterium]|nr:GNAT family N-acetyltransferase [Actinomycetota bacterium]
MSYEVRRVLAPQTYPLRQQVLRPHQTIEQIRLAGEDQPDTASLVIVADDGAVVGTASVMREACPWQPDRADAWRLRGMATAPEVRSRGLGARLLGEAFAHMEQHGGGLLWCGARTPARAFYERHGFAVYGPEWTEPYLGPQVHMWREVRVAP